MAQNPKDKKSKKKVKVFKLNLSWFYILLVVLIGYMLFANSGPQAKKIEWAQVQDMVLSGDVKEVHFIRNDFRGTVTVKPERLEKYSSEFVGGKLPNKSVFFPAWSAPTPDVLGKDWNLHLPFPVRSRDRIFQTE